MEHLLRKTEHFTNVVVNETIYRYKFTNVVANETIAEASEGGRALRALDAPACIRGGARQGAMWALSEGRSPCLDANCAEERGD